jgi:hypothetical protein
MGTVVTIQVVGHGADARERLERESGVARAVAWFQRINDDCTRFDDASELMRLSSTVGVAVPVSALLFEAVQFALAVAEESGGAFDPTFGTNGIHRFRYGGQVHHVAMDGAGRLVVLGFSGRGSRARVNVERFLADGEPDPTFGGGDGREVFPMLLPGGGEAVALLPGGGIVML